jgi:pimeloyl-ACP methyl ester carboxylesterase
MGQVQTAGARVAYKKEGQGPVVLLIQGVGVIGNGWLPQVQGLTDRFTLITFDNRGIGGSEISNGELSIEAMATDALAIMDQEQIASFHVAGHSMGGVIAQQVALSAPHRVKSLSFLCTFACGKQATRLTLSILWLGLRCRIGSRVARRNAFLEIIMPSNHLRTLNRVQLAEELAPLFGHDLADQPSIVMKQLRAMSKYDRRTDLARLKSIPTLVLSATEDKIALPEYGQELAACIPGARFVEIPDAGHGVPIQRAGQVNALLAEHCLKGYS